MKSALISASAGGGFAVTESDEAEYAGVGIDVPAGALAEDTTIFVAPRDDLQVADDAEWVGPAMDLGPDGLELSAPVTINLRVRSALGEDDEPAVRMLSANGGATWVDAASIIVNANGTWSFPVSRLATF